MANGERNGGLRPSAYRAATPLRHWRFAIRLRALIAVPISPKLGVKDRNRQRHFSNEGLA
jgi:hypothetical protein